jgi:hypothetical protein
MGWGNLIGGALGFAIGGPAGAAIGMGLGGAAEEVTGGGASGAARDAAQTANAAAERDLALRTRMYEEDVARQEPWRKAGVNALSQLETASKYTPFGMNQFNADPGYAFRLSEGQKQLDRMAAIRGGQISGSSLKAAARFGQDLGSQEYQNAFNRYQTERSARLNPLQSLAGVGQTATNQLGAAGRDYGSSAGSIMSGQGINSANALLAGQQARSSSYGQLGSALGKYLGSGGTFGMGGGGTFQTDPGAYAFGTQYWD